MRKNVVPDHDVGNVVTEGSQDKPTETLNASVGTDQALIASGEKILLQTAVVPIQTADGSATIMAKVLLDSASHRTFITDQLAKKLKLTCDREELLSVSTFAARTPRAAHRGGQLGHFSPGPSLKGAPGGPMKGPLNTCLKDRYTLIEQSDLNTVIKQSQYSSEEQCSKLIDKEIWLMGSYCHCQQVATFFFFFLVFTLQLG